LSAWTKKQTLIKNAIKSTTTSISPLIFFLTTNTSFIAHTFLYNRESAVNQTVKEITILSKKKTHPFLIAN